jgi:hypothetical protein
MPLRGATAGEQLGANLLPTAQPVDTVRDDAIPARSAVGPIALPISKLEEIVASPDELRSQPARAASSALVRRQRASL